MPIEVLYKSEIRNINRLLPILEADFKKPCKAEVADYNNEVVEVVLKSNGRVEKFYTVDRKTMEIKS